MTDLERALREAMDAVAQGWSDARMDCLALIRDHGPALLAAVQAQVPQPCCTEWETCMRPCIPLAENWRMEAKRLERAAVQAQVPPLEPTQDMLTAGAKEHSAWTIAAENAVESIWRAMYDAAPSAPAVADPIAASSSNEGAEAAAVGATRSTEAAPATGNEAGAVAAKRCADLVASASGHPHADLCARLHDVYEQSFPLRMDAAFAIEAADKALAEREAEIEAHCAQHVRWVREHQADTDAAWRGQQQAEAKLAEREAEMRVLRNDQLHKAATIVRLTLERDAALRGQETSENVAEHWQIKCSDAEDRAEKAEAKVERLRAAVRAVDAGYISFGDMPFAYRNARDKCKEDL